jgi:hypothetical protein
MLVVRRNLRTTRKRCSTGCNREPIADLDNRLTRISGVRVNVLARNIGDEIPITVALRIEDQALLSPPAPVAESPASEEQTKLQRHVEPRQIDPRVKADR